MKAVAATIITTIMSTSTLMAETVLYDLLTWMSPSYPVGAFAHSSGLEWAVEEALVTDRASCAAWIEDWISRGGGWSDAVIFSFAHRAAEAMDGRDLLQVAELALALQTTAERRVEATAQGGAFRRIARSTAACAALSLLDELSDDQLCYPVAVACVTAGHDAELEPALTAYLHGIVANLASAAQRLVPLGQTDGQLIIAGSRALVAETVTLAAGLDGEPFDHIATAGFMADIASMAHETQYTRLFRT